MQQEYLIRNITALPSPTATSFSTVKNTTLAIKNRLIDWVGPEKQLPEAYKKWDEISFPSGKLITPGLIDCHTHLVYAGQRSQEFTARLHGKTYEEIAASGGGILNTVRATRATAPEVLLKEAGKRVNAFLKEGVTTIEVKSGYGLDYETERKILKTARALEQHHPITIKTTCLAAHTLAPEFSDKKSYIQTICQEFLPQFKAQHLCDAVDIFVDTIAFNLEEAELLFKCAQQLNLPIKCHAEQLRDFGAAALAAKYKAISVDHLEYVNKAAIPLLKKANTVAVLLPGAYYYLKMSQLPPIALLRSAQIPMAIGSDCNPGTSPTTSLLLMMNMACQFFGLTPEEALAGVTTYAAQALGLSKTHGKLATGYAADLVIWEYESPEEIMYYYGYNPGIQVVKDGQWLKSLFKI